MCGVGQQGLTKEWNQWTRNRRVSSGARLQHDLFESKAMLLALLVCLWLTSVCGLFGVQTLLGSVESVSSRSQKPADVAVCPPSVCWLSPWTDSGLQRLTQPQIEPMTSDSRLTHCLANLHTRPPTCTHNLLLCAASVKQVMSGCRTGVCGFVFETALSETQEIGKWVI